MVEAAGRQLLLAVTNDQVTWLRRAPGRARGPLPPRARRSPRAPVAVAPPPAAPVAMSVEARPAREPEPLRLLPRPPRARSAPPFDAVLEGIRSFDARAGRRERTA